jgi:hypothetical protein
MAATETKFQKELATYEANRESLVAESEGKYVVIRGEQIAGTWSSYEDALKEGYRLYKLEPFLVKRIEGVESVHYFSREICQS